jgi:alkaline phosphatase
MNTTMSHTIRTTRLAAAAFACAAAGMLATLAGTAHAAGEAKNVIFFLGDGMGPVTVTAARIYKGEKQLAAKPGSMASPERASLVMQSLPYAARVKTFSLDGQTTDSAPSMAAYMTGVKMRNEVISMSSDTTAVDSTGKQYINGENTTCPPTNGKAADTLLELAKAKGRAVGAVSTTRVGHATPATTYAHICNRNGYNTIAEQSVPGHANYNPKLLDGIDVLMGGGQRNYLAGAGTKRTDGVDLVAAMKAKGYTYVDNGTRLKAVDAAATGKLLGLFSSSEMAYELDRVKQNLDQPSLSDMTEKALGVLSKNDKGFFLMVEGGRIDHALHGTNAKRALEDTLAFDTAIQTALDYMNKKDPGLKNTLVWSRPTTTMRWPSTATPRSATRSWAWSMATPTASPPRRPTASRTPRWCSATADGPTRPPAATSTPRTATRSGSPRPARRAATTRARWTPPTTTSCRKSASTWVPPARKRTAAAT